MEEPNKILLAPNGSGSLYDSINDSAPVRNLLNTIEYVQIINDDNILTKVLDPLLIGFTMKYDLYVGLKACERSNTFYAHGGVLAKKDKRYSIVS